MNKKLLGRIMSYAKNGKRLIIAVFLCSALHIGLTLWTPVLIGEAIDLMLGEGAVDFAPIIKILLTIGVITLLSAIFQWLMTYMTNKIAYITVKNMRSELFEKLCGAPIKYIDNSPHGDLISRIVNDIDLIADGLLQGFTQLFGGVVTIIGTMIFMFSINYIIALVVVVLTPLSVFAAAFIAKLCAAKFKEQSKLTGELSAYVEENIGNHGVLKLYNREKASEEAFTDINKRLYHCGEKAQWYSSLTNPTTRFVNGIVYAAAGVAGALITINGGLGMTIGKISGFLTYANQYTKPFNEISGVIAQMQSAFAGASRVFAVIDEPSEADEGNRILSAEDCRGNIEIRNLYFSYTNEKKLIENLNLEVKSGQRIAIVGPTGCGKTTFINLLMRFYDVTDGEIAVDGFPVKSMKKSSLRSLYGMVLQDSWLFEGSVFDNIAYGKPDATLEEVEAAARSAHIHNFITKLPEGYDTIISESGNISQGQKQLLCIARIMLLMPPMLILDEATSNIDTMTERRIQKAFALMMEGRTSFIVAHRLSTIKEVDLILVMRDGNIVEQGTHSELLAAGGFYSRLYNSQFAAETDE